MTTTPLKPTVEDFNRRARGHFPEYLGIVPDNPAEYHARLAGATGFDLLITSGGVSVGAFDFTKDVLRALGADLQLWRVRMRPGAPLGFGMLGRMPWLGLSNGWRHRRHVRVRICAGGVE